MRKATPTETSAGHGRCLLLMLAAMSCGVAIAACGSSSQSGSATASAGAASGIEYAACMRAHGVPKFPDPSPGGGIQISSSSGINPFSPAFKAAQSACGKLLPGGGPGGGPASAQAKEQMLAISTCMRAHGVTGFPDPTTTPPSSPRGYSEVIGRGGVFIAVPDTINAGSPAYTQAAAVCRFGPSGRA